LKADISTWLAYQTSVADRAVSTSRATYRSTIVLMIVVFAVTVLAAFLIGAIISRGIMREEKRAIDSFKRAVDAAARTGGQVSLPGPDLAVLAHSVNQLLHSMINVSARRRTPTKP
jgi:uncharacterized metal-binding protein